MQWYQKQSQFALHNVYHAFQQQHVTASGSNITAAIWVGDGGQLPYVEALQKFWSLFSNQ